MWKNLGVVVVMALVLSASITCSFAQQQENYWAKFNVGSWALYEMGQGMQQKQTLVNKTADELTLKIEMIMNGKAMLGGSEIKIPLKADNSAKGVQGKGQITVKESSDKVEIKGQALDCKVIEAKTDQGTAASWFSDKVPGGLIKTAMNNNVAMRLVDYEVK